MSDDVEERPIMIDSIHHHPQQQPHQSHQPHPSHWDAVVLPPVPPRSNNPTQAQPQPPTASASAPALSNPAPGQHHPADSSRRHLSASRSSSSNHHGQHSSDPYPKSSNKGGVRGRVTVVCAECKRLKLRCSRDRPCTSCVKRACVDRCRYRNDEQPLATGSSGEHRSIIPSSAPGDAVYRLVSISCLQCTNNNSKCDRREPCSHCIKHSVECVYPGLAPLAAPAEANLIQALSRLARLEARITELSVECDQCTDLQLKCDGRAPCSWCVKRHSQAQSHQSHSGGVGRGSAQFDAASSTSLGLPPLQPPGVGAGIGCTYSGYSEQAQRQSLHSPQSSLHASTGSASRDRSPYALRISSPPPPNSSHSTTTTSGSNELHSRISAAENQVGQYMRTHSHSFSHGHSLSHGSSASMGSGVGFAGPGGPGGSTTSYNSTSTLTPITPSHPSSLHHYAVSGSGNLPHSSYSSHPPQHQHQHQHHHSTSSRHSPSQYSPGTNNHHPQASPDQAQSNHHQSYDSHRPRQPSLSNASVLLPPPNPNHPNHPPSSTSPGPFAFGSSSSRHSKIPTPPGTGSSASAGAAPPLPPPPAPAPINAAAAAASAAAAANNAGTKLPEISNILTLLSPAPSSSTTESSKTPHPLRTPVSGVTSSAGHGILNIGGASSIQHTQSDVRGTPTQRNSHEHLRRDSLSHSRGVLPSPSRSISPPHDQPHSHSTSRQSPDSRPSSSENRNPNNLNKLAMYSPSQHRRGISGSYMDDTGGKLSAPSSHVRTFSGASGIRGDMEEDDERTEMEVDEIDTDP